MTYYVGIIGDLTDGHIFLGPFTDRDDAFEACDDEYPHATFYVATMTPPEKDPQ